MKNQKRFDYFASLANMADYALQEALYLKEILENYDPDNLEEQYEKMHSYEHACDTVKHDMMTALTKEFLPPIERDDLFSLAHVTDNLTDSVEAVLANLYMGYIRKLHVDLQPFTTLLVECCEHAKALLVEFPNFRKSKELTTQIITLNDLEETGDRLYGKSMRTLSRECEDVRVLMEWKSIFDDFEKCYDAAESIADNVESAVMKNL